MYMYGTILISVLLKALCSLFRVTSHCSRAPTYVAAFLKNHIDEEPQLARIDKVKRSALHVTWFAGCYSRCWKVYIVRYEWKEKIPNRCCAVYIV